jgi:hypothetical protein
VSEFVGEAKGRGVRDNAGNDGIGDDIGMSDEIVMGYAVEMGGSVLA